MKKIFVPMLVFLALFMSCYQPNTSDLEAQKAQEKLLAQGNAEAGMPAITNFREKKMLKLILEQRDDASYTTYTYMYSDITGKFIYMGTSIGFPIPYSTQYTNPQKFDQTRLADATGGRLVSGVMAQADPNGLFSPSSASGTWVMMIDPTGKPVPTYFEPNVVCFPYKLPAYMLLYQPPKY